MALATKCPHCHTVFRVALDQLKLRGGIVRCGACNEVFDGNAGLVAAGVATASPALVEAAPVVVTPIDTAPALPVITDVPDDADETSPRVAAFEPEPERGPLAPADPRPEPGFDLPSEHIVAVALDDVRHFDETPAEAEPVPEPEYEPEPALQATAGHGASDVVHALDADTLDEEAAAIARRAEADAEAQRAEDTDSFDPADEPDFVKRANRRQQGARLARLGMLAGVPLLLLALLGQGVFTLGSRLAASYPDLKPTLVALCEPLDCTIGLPRQIDALAVEQGELQTLAPDTFSYVTVLRNQSRSVQAWPHVELVLKDAAEKPLLRRVFAPQEYLAAPAGRATPAARQAVQRGLGPRSEQSVKLYFVLDKVQASGYRIAIFYP